MWVTATPARGRWMSTALLAVLVACGPTGDPVDRVSTAAVTGPEQPGGNRGGDETTVPATGSSAEVDRAATVAGELVAALRGAATGGDFSSAAGMWSGYPGSEEEKLSRLEAFVDANPWLAEGRVRFDVVDAWSSDPATAMQVVAITDLSWLGTAAILVDRVGVVGRIQSVDDATGDMEADGARVVLHGVPVEGGLNVYLSGRLLGKERIRVDPDSSSVVISLPDGGESRRREVLIVSAATPELATAVSVIVGDR